MEEAIEWGTSHLFPFKRGIPQKRTDLRRLYRGGKAQGLNKKKQQKNDCVIWRQCRCVNHACVTARWVCSSLNVTQHVRWLMLSLFPDFSGTPLSLSKTLRCCQEPESALPPLQSFSSHKPFACERPLRNRLWIFQGSTEIHWKQREPRPKLLPQSLPVHCVLQNYEREKYCKVEKEIFLFTVHLRKLFGGNIWNMIINKSLFFPEECWNFFKSKNSMRCK